MIKIRGSKFTLKEDKKGKRNTHTYKNKTKVDAVTVVVQA